MSTVDLQVPIEKGVRIIIVEDGSVIDDLKLEPFQKLTIVTQNDKVLDSEKITRKRYR
nr:hypothetical protein [Brevibacillus laterosporus]